MYDLFSELKLLYGDALKEKLILCVGSIRDAQRLDEIFARYRPEVVLHAAAHKHVPLMEDCPDQAVKNNVFGTWLTAQAAVRHGVKRFVLISTDKAVNPTNVMGGDQAPGRDDHRGPERPDRDGIHRRALRKRAGLPRQRGAAL